MAKTRRKRDTRAGRTRARAGARGGSDGRGRGRGGDRQGDDGAPPPAATTVRREIRPYIYAAFDFTMAVIYSVVLVQLPTRHAPHAALLWGTVAAVVVAGAATLVRRRWGRRTAMAALGVMLLATVAILVLLVLSASFLVGVYGAMGRGMAGSTLLVGALVIELVGLLPAFQLKFLMTRAGRRWYGAGAP